MLKIDIKDSDRQLLKDLRYSEPHPRVMRKMDALHLKSFGLENDLICNIIGVCDNTLRGYYKQYLDGGIDQLKEVNFYRPCSDLNEFSGTIEAYFLENPPSSILEAATIIEKLTGINAITHDLSYICNETYINSLTVCELLNQIIEKHTDTNPITIVLDNAKYQCCNLVRNLAECLHYVHKHK